MKKSEKAALTDRWVANADLAKWKAELEARMKAHSPSFFEANRAAINAEAPLRQSVDWMRLSGPERYSGFAKLDAAPLSTEDGLVDMRGGALPLNLAGAMLSGVDASHSDYSHANWLRVVFRDSIFHDVSFYAGLMLMYCFNCTFVKCRFDKASLWGAYFVNSSTWNCSFKGLTGDSMFFDNTVVSDSKFISGGLGASVLRSSRFENVEFSGTMLGRVSSQSTAFLGCSLSKPFDGIPAFLAS